MLESMGSEYYAYFVVEGRVSSSELDELAQDAGAADMPHSHEGSQVVARLDAASRVRQGEDAELWFNATHLQLFDVETGKALLGPVGENTNGNQADTTPAATPAGAAARSEASDGHSNGEG